MVVGPPEGPKVLVVDDDPVIQRLLSVNFEMEGYEVLVAGTGAEGISKARSGQPDVVVLDVMMPGMDGLEVAMSLKADPVTAAIPVLLLSAKAQEADIRAGDATGADAYVTKPFDPLALLELVGRLVGEPKPAEPKPGEPKPGEPKPGEPKPGGRMASGRMASGARSGGPNPGGARPGVANPRLPGQAAPGAVSSGRVRLGRAVTGGAEPNQAAPGRAVTGQAAPNQAAPNQAAPSLPAPNQAAPSQAAPGVVPQDRR